MYRTPLRTLALWAALTVAGTARAGDLRGSVGDEAGKGLAGVLVTARRADLHRGTTVVTDDRGAFRIEGLEDGLYDLRARRVGFGDVAREGIRLPGAPPQRFVLRLVAPGEALDQLPASAWLARVRFPSAAVQGEFAIQCAMCHQQGSKWTRFALRRERWGMIFDKMADMGAVPSRHLRDEMPAALNEAYDLDDPSRGPPLPPPTTGAAAREVVTEWDLGEPTSMLHDIVLGRDGAVYAVDWMMDEIHRLDPRTGRRTAWSVPHDGEQPGGVLRRFAMRGTGYTHVVPYVAPHSIQAAPDGSLWITLSLGHGLARLDPATGEFRIFRQPPAGVYPHTLRFDREGRVWYTLAVSNHVASFDPKTGAFRLYRLPTRTLGEAAAVRFVRPLLWLADALHLTRAPIADPEILPIPYGIDVAPDGSVWVSQFNNRRIGRLDPATGEIRTFDTPFYGPRRFRIDSKGRLWIPAYADGGLYRFDPDTEKFTRYALPTGAGELPYSVALDRRTDDVWVCGSNSDTLIRFQPARERFTVFPLPTRVTFTREIEVDGEGNVWTSYSNMPGWQIEGGRPKVVRLSGAVGAGGGAIER